VEDSEQYHRLLEAGCTKVQGFWFCKPLPLDQFIYFVKEDIRWSGLPIGLIHMAECVADEHLHVRDKEWTVHGENVLAHFGLSEQEFSELKSDMLEFLNGE